MNTNGSNTARTPGGTASEPRPVGDRSPTTCRAGRSILVAVDGGPSGWPALDWAADEAVAHHSTLRIVHVVDWPRWNLDALGELAFDWGNTDAPDRGALILEEAARRSTDAAPHATVTTHLEAGEPAGAILEASRNDTLIVVGLGRQRRPRSRSVSRTVVRLARCPVAVIRTPAAAKTVRGRP